MGEKLSDKERFAHLFTAHCDDIYAYAVRRVGVNTAEDVTAETFAVCWRRFADVPDPALPWLYGVARNVVLHEQRSSAGRARLVTKLSREREPSAEVMDAIDVNSVLDQLEPMDAEVLRLTVWEQLTPAEIAQALDITPNAARQRLFRARSRAHHVFVQEGGHHV